MTEDIEAKEQYTKELVGFKVINLKMFWYNFDANRAINGGAANPFSQNAEWQIRDEGMNILAWGDGFEFHKDLDISLYHHFSNRYVTTRAAKRG